MRPNSGTWFLGSWPQLMSVRKTSESDQPPEPLPPPPPPLPPPPLPQPPPPPSPPTVNPSQKRKTADPSYVALVHIGSQRVAHVDLFVALRPNGHIVFRMQLNVFLVFLVLDGDAAEF